MLTIELTTLKTPGRCKGRGSPGLLPSDSGALRGGEPFRQPMVPPGYPLHACSFTGHLGGSNALFMCELPWSSMVNQSVNGYHTMNGLNLNSMLDDDACV